MLRDTLLTKAFTARTLTAAGILAPQRPDRLARALAVLGRWGTTDGRRVRGFRDPLPRRPSRSSTTAVA